MPNPSTIMGANALSWVDVAEGGMFQDTAGTTPAGDGDPVGYLPDLVSGAFTTTNTAWRPTYRANAGDPYLQGNLSNLRRSLTRTGNVYVAYRARFPVEAGNTPHLAVFSTNEGTFYSGSDWFTLRKQDFGIPRIESEPTYVQTGITEGTFETYELYSDGTNTAVAVNGGTWVTATGVAANTLFYDLFGGRDGASLDGSVGQVDIRRGVVLNTIPDSTQRAALLDWAENGDPGEPTGTQINYWTGAAWAPKPLMRWNGTAWVPAQLQRWTGTAWVNA